MTLQLFNLGQWPACESCGCRSFVFYVSGVSPAARLDDTGLPGRTHSLEGAGHTRTVMVTTLDTSRCANIYMLQNDHPSMSHKTPP